jgi:hypothetical protein
MLKGASLLDHVYKEIGVRPMGDLDIMVKTGDFPVVQKRLQGLGYVRESPNARIYQRGGVRIDLHNHPLNVDRIRARQALFPSALGPVWASSEPWRPNLPNLRCPDDADNVIFLAQHLMKHSFSRLIWLVDIQRLLENRDHAFWTRLRERTYLFGQWRPLCYVIYLLNRLFGFAPPARSPFGGLSDRLTRLEKAVLDTSLYNGRCVLTGPLLSLICVDDFRSRMKLASEILFPRWSIVKQEFGGRRPGDHFFFYPARLIRLTSLVARLAIDIKRHAGPGNPERDG